MLHRPVRCRSPSSRIVETRPVRARRQAHPGEDRGHQDHGCSSRWPGSSRAVRACDSKASGARWPRRTPANDARVLRVLVSGLNRQPKVSLPCTNAVTVRFRATVSGRSGYLPHRARELLDARSVESSPRTRRRAGASRPTWCESAMFCWSVTGSRAKTTRGQRRRT